MTDHPTLPGRVGGSDVADVSDSWPVRPDESSTVHESPYLDLRLDVIEAPDGSTHTRAVVAPNGAVGVLAIDDQDRVLLVRQYRHAQQARVVEIPAGTLDVDGEAPLTAAQRELGEEAEVVAADWQQSLHLAATPGYSSERLTIFRASGLTPLPADERTELEGEEATLERWWVPFADVVDSVLAGRISDAKTAAAVLAELARRP